MPTRKIGYRPVLRTCRDPGHHPAQYAVFPPGDYEHVCRVCGAVTRFTVNESALLRGTP